MSVLLQTTNPEAAAEFQDRDTRRPHEGQSVIFHVRPGEGRGGRTSAVAWVLRVEDEDHVDILICYDADDFIVRNKIPRKTDQNNVNAWAFNDWDRENYHKQPPPNAPGDSLHVALEELRKEFDASKKTIQRLDAALAKKK